MTDDAAVVDRHACQLEAWHGPVESWIQPACQFIRRLEFTIGIGFLARNGGRSVESLLEAKYLFRELDTDDLGIGLVLGTTTAAPGRLFSDGLDHVHAYVPLSLSRGGDRLVLHANVGWRYADAHDRAHDQDEHDHAHERSRHALTWAFRGDVVLPIADQRLIAIGEAFGEDRLRPGYQIGLRVEAVRDRLFVDVTWGGHADPLRRGLDWTLGMAWTPPPLR